MNKKVIWGAAAFLLAVPSFVYVYLSKFSPTYSMLAERLDMGQRPVHLFIYELCGIALYGFAIFLLISVAVFVFKRIKSAKSS